MNLLCWFHSWLLNLSSLDSTGTKNATSPRQSQKTCQVSGGNSCCIRQTISSRLSERYCNGLQSTSEKHHKTDLENAAVLQTTSPFPSYRSLGLLRGPLATRVVGSSLQDFLYSTYLGWQRRKSVVVFEQGSLGGLIIGKAVISGKWMKGRQTR